MSKRAASPEAQVLTEVLGIDLTAGPPNYYELLGVDPEAKDAEEIARAAEKRAQILRRDTPAELKPAAQHILRMVSQARVCLSDPDARAAYDQRMGIAREGGAADRRQLGSAGASQVHSRPTPHRAPPQAPVMERHSVRVEKRRRKSRRVASLAIAGIAVSTIVVGGALLAAFLWSEETGSVADSDVSIESDRYTRPADEASREAVPRDGASRAGSASRIDEEETNGPQPSRSTDDPDATSRNAALAPVPDPSSARPARRQNRPLPGQVPAGRAAESIFNLVPAVTLPPVDPEADDAQEGPVTVSLGSVSSDLADSLQFEVIPPEAQTDSYRYAVAEMSARSNEHVWGLGWIAPLGDSEANVRSSLDSESGARNRLVAGIRLREGALEFAWAPGGASTLGEQLRHCALAVSCGDRRKVVKLSEVRRLPPLTLDLAEERQTVSLEQSPLPPAHALSWEVQEVDLYLTDYVVEPEAGVIASDDAIQIEIAGWTDEDWSGEVEVFLRLDLDAEEEAIVLHMLPRFRWGRGWKSLDTESYDETLRNAQQALSRNQAVLRDARSAASSLPSQISSAEAALRRSDRSSPAAAGAARRLASLRSQLRRANSAVRRMSRSVPTAQQSIKRLTSLRKIAQALDGGTLRLRFFIELTDGEVELITMAENDDAGRL